MADESRSRENPYRLESDVLLWRDTSRAGRRAEITRPDLKIPRELLQPPAPGRDAEAPPGAPRRPGRHRAGGAQPGQTITPPQEFWQEPAEFQDMVASERPPRERRAPRKGRGHRPGKRAGMLAAAALALVAAVGGVLVLRSGGDQTVSQAGSKTVMELPEVAKPVTGRALSFVTPEGDRYSVAAVRGTIGAAPIPGLPPAPAGTGYPYIDYVLTNLMQRPVLLDYPPNIFLRQGIVPPDFVERCTPQKGAPDNFCDIPSQTRVIGRLPGSASPVKQDVDTFMPPGASYLVRIVAEAPVDESVVQGDMDLYVYQARFTRDRIARYVPFTS